jgi:hypothetical protein
MNFYSPAVDKDGNVVGFRWINVEAKTNVDQDAINKQMIDAAQAVYKQFKAMKNGDPIKDYYEPLQKAYDDVACPHFMYQAL